MAEHVDAPRHWRLMLGGKLMADLSFKSYETPWLTVSARASACFVPFLPYFTDPETWPDDDPIFDAMVKEVDRLGDFRLVDEAGFEMKQFSLVNVDDHGANLRY